MVTLPMTLSEPVSALNYPNLDILHLFSYLRNECSYVRRGFYCPDSASSLYYKGSASLNGTIKLSVCA